MQTENEAYTTEKNGWTVRIQPPGETSNPRSMLLIHGWTGDEKVMWIFTPRLPDNYWLFAPRGPVELAPGSYAWLPHSGKLPGLDEFKVPAQSLLQAFKHWADETGAPNEPVDVMGFSQGAAMAYSLAATYPEQVGRVIALAGFLPTIDQMPGPYENLRNKRIYIAHGTKDEIVSVENAQIAARELNKIGADVTYCESEVGHKLSADCLRGLSTFMQKD